MNSVLLFHQMKYLQLWNCPVFPLVPESELLAGPLSSYGTGFVMRKPSAINTKIKPNMTITGPQCKGVFLLLVFSGKQPRMPNILYFLSLVWHTDTVFNHFPYYFLSKRVFQKIDFCENL